MKFFLDTANLEEIETGAKWGVLDGVTTNPTLIAREGRPLEEQIRRICDIVDGDISAEVIATETSAMIEEGRRLARIHKNVVVKCPLTRDGIRATSALHKEGIRVNVTLCFTAGQALLAAKAGAYFVIRAITQIYRNYGFRTQILAASLRSPTHVVDAALAGADIGTMPFKVMDMLFNHPLTDKGLDQFLKDYAKVFHETSVAR